MMNTKKAEKVTGEGNAPRVSNHRFDDSALNIETGEKACGICGKDRAAHRATGSISLENNELGRAERRLWTAQHDEEYTKKRLIDAAKSVQNRMTSLLRQLEHGGSVNSLGELQSSGPGLDVLCMQYSCKQTATAAAAAHLQDVARKTEV